MHRIAEPVQRDRLDMILQVRGFLVRSGAGEDAELARRHRHRAGTADEIFKPDRRLAEQAARLLVEGRHAADLVGHAQLQMVLQVFPDPSHLVQHVDAGPTKDIAPADTGKFEDVRRADRAGRQHGFLRRIGALGDAVMLVLDPDDGIPLNQQPADLSVGQHRQIGPLRRRAQKGLRRVPADAGALVDVEIAGALVVATVEVVAFRECRPPWLPRGTRRARPSAPAPSTRHSPPAPCASSSPR